MAIVESLSSASVSSNWMPDRNRFNLPKPPAWFLKSMWDMDPMLVIAPSRQSAKYLIMRRRERSQVFATVIETTPKKHRRVEQLDADLFESSKCVAVDTIIGNVMSGSWSPAILARLKARDMWGDGGADAYIAKIEQDEEANRQKQRRDLLDNIDHRSRDAYRSYKARTGQRSRLTVTPKESSLSSRTAGSGHGSSSVVLTDFR
jgi:hypothetical protein